MEKQSSHSVLMENKRSTKGERSSKEEERSGHERFLTFLFLAGHMNNAPMEGDGD